MVGGFQSACRLDGIEAGRLKPGGGQRPVPAAAEAGQCENHSEQAVFDQRERLWAGRSTRCPVHKPQSKTAEKQAVRERLDKQASSDSRTAISLSSPRAREYPPGEQGAHRQPRHEKGRNDTHVQIQRSETCLIQVHQYDDNGDAHPARREHQKRTVETGATRPAPHPRKRPQTQDRKYHDWNGERHPAAQQEQLDESCHRSA